jgi:hypothetical protein
MILNFVKILVKIYIGMMLHDFFISLNLQLASFEELKPVLSEAEVCSG